MIHGAISRPQAPVLYRPAGLGCHASVVRVACAEDSGEYRALPNRSRPAFSNRNRAFLPNRNLAAIPVRRSSRAPARSPLEVSLRLADALAISIRAALDRVAVPLARAAAAFTARRCWEEFGFARLDDHARERFGRSGRWVNDCAALGRSLESLPLLVAALTGDDGGRPIGRVAAILVGRVATPDSAAAWVALARNVSVRDLREAIRATRPAGSSWPAGSPGSPRLAGPPGPASSEDDSSSAPRASGASDDHAVATDELSERSLVRILVPTPVLAAFDEAVDLFRCVEGHEAAVTSFVEALVGEACAAGFPPDADTAPMNRSPDVAAVESALARSTDNWSHLASTSPASWSLAQAGVSVARLREIDRVAGSGGAADLDGQVRALLALEEDLQGRLAAVLADMTDRGAWPRLRFAGVGHYAEERLGISRTSAEDRVRAARSLRQLPLLRAAHEGGRIGFEAVILILRILGRGPVDAALEAAWVARAEAATVKRLRDEARAIGRRGSDLDPRSTPDPRHALGPDSGRGPDPDSGRNAARRAPGSPFPLDDDAWHASLRREPGLARARVHRFGMASAEVPSPDVFLRLRLPHDLAADLLAAVESARSRLSGLVDSVPWDEPWPDPDATPSVIAARTFSVASRRVPGWVGLLALLEDFVQTWDPEERGRGAGPGPIKRPGDAVYSRSGWRCTAPGCTSRRNLEDHHVVYRSRGGRDELSNRICLCRFHHQRGEHGDLASCRGRAPLGILWRLGRRPLAAWYRNERRVAPIPRAGDGVACEGP